MHFRSHISRWHALGAALAFTLGATSSDALAGTANSSFTVTGTVVANCTISTTGISFTYDPTSATDATATGTVTALAKWMNTVPLSPAAARS